MADDFLSDGVVVRDGFVPPQHVQDLIDCAARRRVRGEFSAARIGAHPVERREDIRGDSTCWFAPPLHTAEARLLQSLEQLRLDLNREAFLGLFDLELHYAWYPPGAGYARHVDQPRGRGQRVVSFILYLNPHWTADAGGSLRFFGASDVPRDVEPVAGRLVYFLTTGREHAVLPTRADRLSVTGWFRQRPATPLDS